MLIRDQDALEYHSQGRKGKIEVISSKPCISQRDLSMAYTPGVAAPCRVINENPDEVFNYTARGNLVAVVSNCTAVLGLGDIGPIAGKPVMEGKGVLFKRFADIDVFDLEIASKDPDDVVKVVKLLEPTFGGINLEDIKAPECFYIEEQLRQQMNIPVFHDDQHGTAIISGAALLNALELAGKKIEDVRVVFNGAGAAGIACARYYVSLGVKKENIIMCDTKGVIYKGRKEKMNRFKEEFAAETDCRTLADALKGADVFTGLSGPNCVTKEMVRSMADNPIIFAMANPDPEISYEDAKAARPDAIIATGRSDCPNQVNNVLCFPFIFRGALDVRARAINEEMKLAATRALADLAKEDIPDSVLKAYGESYLSFGRDYILPKPLDPRVLLWEAPAVAKAAMETGVARIQIDLDKYREHLEILLGKSREIMRVIINKAKAAPKRIVFPEGEESKILRASQIILDEKIAVPILLGNERVIKKKIKNLNLDLKKLKIIDPTNWDRFEDYVQEFYRLRQRRGVTLVEAREFMANKNYFGAMMVHMGDADGLISGITQHYPETIRPALQVIRMRETVKRVSGLYIIITKNEAMFFADTTVNIEPTAEELAEIALCAAEVAKRFDVTPKIAMLSFSNFGSTRHPLAEKVRRATEIVQERAPELMVDGEMQADTAVVPEIIEETYPFSQLKGPANILIFPDLEAGNIAYKLMQRIGGAEAIGPILMGMRKPVHVLQRGAEVNDIVNMTAIAVVDAQELC
ncbi:phosphate acetyltransferase [candidate division KSB1 bacterium]|nr:phosphate acetyltransferase [bacterium]OQX59366.1 MAG: phosphate acetyltransferase [candidate division KSB1 bacterium 4484_219]RKY78423.1 MAG: phosphate acetyltransferase [candidate division KSB1 bacterium]RKY86075.1 MAG: phosphate acetyltransferase [candidate division KSB1 bacterium]RKY93169.1 MAG: phosphate acetyltransferase [candidate division KSB1 bacterium]